MIIQKNSPKNALKTGQQRAKKHNLIGVILTLEGFFNRDRILPPLLFLSNSLKINRLRFYRLFVGSLTDQGK